MALVKVKPTSPGRRAVVKVVNPDLHKGGPYAPLLEKQSKKAGRNVNGHITMRHQGGGHKQHYRIVDFRRDKDGIVGQGRAPRIRSEPQRQPRAAVLRGRRAPLHHRAQGRRRGRAARCPVPKRRSSRATRCRCATFRSAPPSTASRCSPARARSSRARRALRCSCSRAKAATPRCGCAPGEIRKVHVECRATIGEVGNEEHSLESIGKAGARALARRAADGARCRDEPDRPPARRRRRQDRRRPRSGQSLGHAHQGLQDAQEQAHARA